MSISISYSIENNPYTVNLSKGSYLIELWGAEGGTWGDQIYGGRGAYTKGILRLYSKTTLYFYIGEKGSYITGKVGIAPATFNGGGLGRLVYSLGNLAHYGSSGGGATDVRTVKGANWSEKESLESRIMVSAGGGGAQCQAGVGVFKGGYGGSLSGGNGAVSGNHAGITDTVGGYQNSTGSSGGKGDYCSGTDGSLGIGGNGGNCYSTCGGGGGYYGGGGSGISCGNHQSGAGGSSYISGLHPTDVKQLVFSRAKMIAGNQIITEPDGTKNEGHAGNGFARITFIKSCTLKRSAPNLSLISIITLVLS